MKISVSDSFEAMSQNAFEEIIQLMQRNKQPLICTASGDSPAGLYKEIVSHVKNNRLDVSNWHFVSLDEWAGMNANDEGSCRFHLNNQLFHPLQIPDDKICFFDGRAKDLENECSKVEDCIQQHEGIDVAIVGLGLNGHVGMNEPGTSAELKSHVAEIDPQTQQVGQKYFKEQRLITHGITLGIASIMNARNVVLLVSGKHKADILKKVLEGEISKQLPASLLRKHPSFFVFADKEAASMLDVKNYE